MGARNTFSRKALAERIAGDATEVDHRPIEPRDRPGDVVRTAARRAAQAAVAGHDQVDQGLPGHHDHTVARHRATTTVTWSLVTAPATTIGSSLLTAAQPMRRRAPLHGR